MLVRLCAAAIVAIASSQALAAKDPIPYQPIKRSMSIQEMFGVVRRDDAGYHPTQSVCGLAFTCAAACGAGYDQCSSSDKQVHCYNPAVKQTCCPDGTGNSCNAGFYCAADSASKTWCCPDGMDLATCAAKFGVTGALHSETPSQTSTPASSTAVSGTLAPTVSSSSSSASVTGAVFVEDHNSTAILPTATGTGTGGVVAGNTTGGSGSATSTSSSSQLTSGASVVRSAGLLAVFGAAALAALL